MKLELKHLAPYLPYKLKVIIPYYQEKGILDLVMLSKYKANLSNGGSVHLWQEQHIDKIKPILRPLSDLTKEIYHNGETFISLDELTEGETVGMSLNDYAEDWDNRTFYSFERYVNEWIKGDNHNLDFLPFGFIQKLFEWHFDIYGLIEQGLAIDINTIEND